MNYLYGLWLISPKYIFVVFGHSEIMGFKCILRRKKSILGWVMLNRFKYCLLEIDLNIGVY